MAIDETLKVKETRSRPQVGGAPMGGLQVRRPWVIPDNGLTRLGNSLGVLSKSVIGAVDDYHKSEMEQAEKDFNKGIPKEEAVAQASFGSRTVTGLAYDTLAGIQAGKEANFDASNNAMDFAQEIKPSTEEDPRTPGEQASDLYDQEGRSLAKNLESQTAQNAFLKTWQNNKPDVLSKIGQAYTTNVRMVHTNNAINDITTAILKPSLTDQSGNPVTTNNQIARTLAQFDEIAEAQNRPSFTLQEKSTIITTAILSGLDEISFDEKTAIQSVEEAKSFKTRVSPIINNRKIVSAKARGNLMSRIDQKISQLTQAQNVSMRKGQLSYTERLNERKQEARIFHATGEYPPQFKTEDEFIQQSYFEFGLDISGQEFVQNNEAAPPRLIQALISNLLTGEPINYPKNRDLHGKSINNSSDLSRLVSEGEINHSDYETLKKYQDDATAIVANELKEFEPYIHQVSTYYARTIGLSTEETSMSFLAQERENVEGEGGNSNSNRVKQITQAAKHGNTKRALQKGASLHFKQDLIKFLANHRDMPHAQKVEWVTNMATLHEEQLRGYNQLLEKGEFVSAFDGSILYDGTPTDPSVFAAEQVITNIAREQEIFKIGIQDLNNRSSWPAYDAKNAPQNSSVIHGDTFDWTDYGRPWNNWAGNDGHDIKEDPPPRDDFWMDAAKTTLGQRESYAQGEANNAEKDKQDAADRIDEKKKSDALMQQAMGLYKDRMTQYELDESFDITNRIVENNSVPVPRMFAVDPLDEVALFNIVQNADPDIERDEYGQREPFTTETIYGLKHLGVPYK